MSRLAELSAKYADDAVTPEPAPEGAETSDDAVHAAPEPADSGAASGASADNGAPERGPDGKFLPKGEKAAEKTAIAKEAEPKPAEAPKPAESKPAEQEDPKLAAKFAALSRKVNEVRQYEESITAKERALAEREARIKAFEEAEKDDDAFFAYLEKRGIPADKIIERAKRAGSPELKAIAPVQRELEETRKEFKEYLEQQKREADERANREAQDIFFEAISDETKHEASHAIFSKAEMLHWAEEVAKDAIANQVTLTSAQMAEAVERIAQRDPRWKKVSSWRQPQPAVTQSNAAQAAPERNPQIGRQAATAKTITNQHAGERATNGEGRLSHRDRLARLMSRSD